MTPLRQQGQQPAFTSPPPQHALPFELVRTELQEVERELQEQARAFDPAVEGYVTYVCGSAGKRIRPALALLSGGATGGMTAEHRRLSVIIEMIHIASLVHDDIMDGADTRRGMATAATKWGHSLSVLLGDALFAYALELATRFDDIEICRVIAIASREVCTGEIIQTQRRFDLNLTIEEYLRVIEMKTAALFAVAAELGAKLNQQPEPVQAALRSFGNDLGVAYQIYDDCLDLVGDENKVGKTLRTDLTKGKLTLPMLYLLKEATGAQKTKLSRMLLQGEPMDTNLLAGIADYEGAVERAVRHGQGLIGHALANLGHLPPSACREALENTAQYLRVLLDNCRVIT